ncbi:MAG: 3,4-dihydroxy-2-butanone-4-phosphate synthase [Candidatus Thermoplasmatota archaeon]|nr:3,4-dihydroxy-2-butanone-4-phosphate synthase [Candidatus Thermoplasmatota archaeon]
MSSSVERALRALAGGSPILVYDADGREEETDLVIPSEFITPIFVKSMRKEAGGLICSTLPFQVASKLGLPLLEEALARLEPHYPLFGDLVSGPLPYDTRSAFSISVNHRKAYTGITDRDRALTISALAGVCGEVMEATVEWARRLFTSEFRSPGHVPILIAENPLLEGRRGHTELATALTIMAGVLPTATLCEMMGDQGGALPRVEAKKYARDRNLVFIEGQEVLEAWGKWSGSWQQESLISSI